MGPLTLIDHLTAADTSAEAFEVSMVGFDVVRDRLGSAGEVGPETCASLRYQLRPDAEDYPVLGRWLAGLIDTIRCRRDLDAAITFLEETRRVWAALPSAPVKHGGDAASRDARAAGSPPAEVVTQRVGADELGPWQQRP